MNLGPHCSCGFSSDSGVRDNFPLKEKIYFSSKTEMTLKARLAASMNITSPLD